MRKDSGSATAVGVAMLRAMHQLIDGEEKLLDDPIALRLVPAEWISYALKNRFQYFDPTSIALRAHIALRSRYAEDSLAAAVQRGVKQYLLLGAGFDTFAYRQPMWAKDITIVEADYPTSQQEKISALQEADISIPRNVSFVAVDLERDDLPTIFSSSTLDIDAPIFISCLGVLVYLSQAGVDSLFHFAGELPVNSEVVFTISGRDTEKSEIAERVATMGEPWLTHFDENELREQLLQAGFTKVIFETPESIIANYFQDSRIQLPAPKRNALVRAIR